MTFDELELAQEFSRWRRRKIYCQIKGIPGVFEVYPGGRTVKHPEIERYLKRLNWNQEDVWEY